MVEMRLRYAKADDSFTLVGSNKNTIPDYARTEVVLQYRLLKISIGSYESGEQIYSMRGWTEWTDVPMAEDE